MIFIVRSAAAGSALFVREVEKLVLVQSNNGTGISSCLDRYFVFVLQTSVQLMFSYIFAYLRSFHYYPKLPDWLRNCLQLEDDEHSITEASLFS